MTYYIYILNSLKDNSYYIGVTHHLTKRVAQHNQGLSKSTKHKLPWKLVHYEKFNNINDAYKKEKYIKSRKKRKFIEQLIRNK